jgi:hypothetical protein
MKINEDGLLLSKPELVALLAFASDDAGHLHLYGVQFKANGAHVSARSSNGHVAAEVVGECDGVTGEWFVHRDFLLEGKKLLSNETALRLSFSAASLRDAVIVDDDGNVRSTLQWPEEAALSQLTLPDINSVLDGGTAPRKLTSISLNADYLGLLKLISRAAGNDRIDCFPPKDKDGAAVFACNGADTNWRAVIMPLRAKEDATE